MAGENKNKKNAGANGAAQIEGAKNNEGGTAAGAKKSTGPQLPVTSTPSGGTATRVSPQAITSMVGQSLKSAMGGGKRMPKIPGLPKASGGGRTSNGEKPLLLAIFFVVYAKWTDFLRFVAWGQVKNIFVDGAEQTVENRIVMVGGPDGNVAYQGAFSGVAAWFKETLNLDVVRGENGAWVTPTGYAVVSVWNINEKSHLSVKMRTLLNILLSWQLKPRTLTLRQNMKARLLIMAKQASMTAGAALLLKMHRKWLTMYATSTP